MIGRVNKNTKEGMKYWKLRRDTFKLLREKIKDRHSTPFVDDIIVKPELFPEFLPKLTKIMDESGVFYTISGHLGDGNLHIIPLMDIASRKDQAKLEPVMREVIPIVLEYGGTMAGEHNDGMVRGPWLPAVFGNDVYQLFKQTKEIFDPQYIFNPNKKTDASWEYSMDHIRSHNANGLIK